MFPPTAYISVVEVPEIRVLVYLEINETYKQRVLKLYVAFSCHDSKLTMILVLNFPHPGGYIHVFKPRC